MKYSVTYLDLNGKKHIDNIENTNIDNILTHYKSNNFRILNIKEHKDIKASKNLSKNIKPNVLNSFLNQFSILLKSGIDVKFALKTLREQENNSLLKEALKNIENNLNYGFTLSEAFSKANVFPELISGTISAGEASSKLPETLKILSEYYEADRKTKESLKNALYYPGILLLVTFLVVILIVTFVLPRYIELFNSYENLELPLITRMLIYFSSFMYRYGLIVFLLIIFGGLLLIRLANNRLLYGFSKIILKIPFIGNYIRNYETQKFSGIFSLLIGSGIDTIESIKIASNSINNQFLKNEILNSVNYILKGNTIYDSFSKTDVFPNMFLNLVNIGEHSSNLVETMDISFNYYKDIVNQQSKKLTAIFEPIIIIIVSLIVGSIVIAIALPTFSLVNIL